MDYRIFGAQLNSAIYLAGCFIGGMYSWHPLAWKFAIAAAGVTYLSYLAQITGMPRLANGVTVISIVLGATAGIALLV